MTVHVRYSAQVRLAAGTAAEAIELPAGASASDLLESLAARHGPQFRELLFGPARKAPPVVMVFVGDEQVQWAVPRPLKEGDAVMILSPISGG